MSRLITCKVHNGREFVPIVINEGMVPAHVVNHVALINNFRNVLMFSEGGLQTGGLCADAHLHLASQAGSKQVWFSCMDLT